MKLKEFTLKLAYKLGGKETSLVLDSADVFAGYSDKQIGVTAQGGDGALKILLKAESTVELTLAELIYDRYYEKGDAFFANGFQSWTVSKEYRHGEQQKGLSAICHAIPVAKKFAGASGDYHFTQYGRDLYHSFTYTYVRSGDKVDLIGSLNERTGYTVFYADMRENILAVVKDVDGLTLKGEYELFDLVQFVGGYDAVFDAYFAAYPQKHTGRVKHFAGYTSWYNYYQNIDEKIILRDLEGLRRAEDEADIFQIDDGFETMVGDWTIDAGAQGGTLARAVRRAVQGGDRQNSSRVAHQGQEGQTSDKRHRMDGLLRAGFRTPGGQGVHPRSFRARIRRVGLRYGQAGLPLQRRDISEKRQDSRTAHVRGYGLFERVLRGQTHFGMRRASRSRVRHSGRVQDWL